MVVDLLDADQLAGEDLAEIDLAPVEADSPHVQPSRLGNFAA